MKRLAIYVGICLSAWSCLCYPDRTPIGVILKRGEETPSTIVRYAVWSNGRSSSDSFIIEVLNETVVTESPINVARATCRLLAQGIVGLITTSTSLSYPIIASYANEFHFPFFTPEIAEVPSELSVQYAFKIRTSTTRAILDLLRYYQVADIIYIYDNNYGLESVHRIFLVGYRTLRLNLIGIQKVQNAEEGNRYLQRLSTNKKASKIIVILDVEPYLARSIVIQHAHDIHVGKENFHFLLSKPALEEFWVSQQQTFSSLEVTGFLATLPDQTNAKNFKEEWRTLSPKIWSGAGAENLDASSYFYYDAALAFSKGLEKAYSLSQHSLYNPGSRSASNYIDVQPHECFKETERLSLKVDRLRALIRSVNITDGLTGGIKFRDRERENVMFAVVKTTSQGYTLGFWSDKEGLKLLPKTLRANETRPAAQVNNRRFLKITTIVSPPYMMFKPENCSLLSNDCFEGYCKDILDLLAKKLDFDYQLNLVKDATYGRYNKSKGRWNGIIKQLIEGEVDLAVADLIVTAERQRVVAFTDPFETVSFSLLMKNPNALRSTSSRFFALLAFTWDVWLCILAAIVLYCVLFHLVVRFTGAPDSIESATRIWGQKHGVSQSVWFILGSMTLMQGVGIYPRSISSRIVGGIWWFFTLIMTSLYIASIVAQLRLNGSSSENSPRLNQLQSLSMESIIEESVLRGWPSIGIVRNSHTSKFIKGSTLPTYKKYSHFLDTHSTVKVDTAAEGIERVEQSQGDFIFLYESSNINYFINQKPCDKVATHDSMSYAGYGLAFPLGSYIRREFNDALNDLKHSGMLAHLYRKWWIETNQCGAVQRSNDGLGLHMISGLFYLVLVGFCIIGIACWAQCILISKFKEHTRRKLSLDDRNVEINLHSTLPPPTRELLLDLPES